MCIDRIEIALPPIVENARCGYFIPVEAAYNAVVFDRTSTDPIFIVTEIYDDNDDFVLCKLMFFLLD